MESRGTYFSRQTRIIPPLPYILTTIGGVDTGEMVLYVDYQIHQVMFSNQTIITLT